MWSEMRHTGDFNIHDPAWWDNDDAIYDAQLDAYDGQPMNAAIMGNLVTLNWTETGRLRHMVKMVALELGRLSLEQPKPRGRPPKSRVPVPDPAPSTAREIAVSANEGRVELLHRKLSAEEARELGARLIQAA